MTDNKTPGRRRIWYEEIGEAETYDREMLGMVGGKLARSPALSVCHVPEALSTPTGSRLAFRCCDSPCRPPAVSLLLRAVCLRAAPPPPPRCAGSRTVPVDRRHSLGSTTTDQLTGHLMRAPNR